MAIEPDQTPRTPPEVAEADPRVPVVAGVEATDDVAVNSHVPVDRKDHQHEAPPEAPERTALERSAAYRAYHRRLEDGLRFLSSSPISIAA